MAKRKCRMTAEEIEVHKRAVALRKMTDEQLVNEVDGKKKFSATVLRADIDAETAEKLKKALEENTEPLMTVSKYEGRNEIQATVDLEACGKREEESHSDIEKLLAELKEGNCKGIGKVTAEKLFSYCIDKGYAKFGMREV